MNIKQKLEELNTQALAMEEEVKGVNGNHGNMMTQLETIHGFIRDSKTAIANEVANDAGVDQAYTDLKDTLGRLEREINTLKTQNTTLKNKIATVAGLCVFSGIAVGSLGLLAIKALIERHPPTNS